MLREAADKLETVASKKAGLLGVSELSNDMRDLREAIKAGNAKARLAVDKFTWTIAKWIGSYVAELNGLDMLVFTGGIGENDIDSRAEICAGLGALGIVVDPQRNNVRGAAVISADNSPRDGARDSAAEDLIIVNHVVRLLANKHRLCIRVRVQRQQRFWSPPCSTLAARLFYTEGLSPESSSMPHRRTFVESQNAFLRPRCAAFRGACWLISSPSFFGARWCARPAQALAAATIGRCAMAP